MLKVNYDVAFQEALLLHLMKDSAFWGKHYLNVEADYFGPSYLSLVFDLFRLYFTQYDKLPSVTVAYQLVNHAVEQPEGYAYTVGPMELDALGTFLERYALEQLTPEDTQFYESNVAGFVAAVKWQRAQMQGLSTQELLQTAAEINEGLKSVNSGTFTLGWANESVAEEESACGERFGLGVPLIDSGVAGGIMRKQAGLIVAGTGVGKTTSMTGAMASNAVLKRGGLYITLEMTAARIRERYHGILAGIPATLFKKPKSQWPEAYRKRLELVTDPAFGLARYGVICDMSGTENGVFDIEQAIIQWKEMVYKAKGDPDEDCCTVYIDWLDRISDKGLAGTKLNKTSSEERLWFHVTEKLYQFANKHNLGVWVSTQAKPEAKGKERINLKDVAWGGSKAHLMDLAVGFCVVNTEEPVRSATSTISETPVGGMEKECSRLLNCCYMKTRDTSNTDSFVTVYQDPTLKLWDSKRDAQTKAQLIKNNYKIGLQ